MIRYLLSTHVGPYAALPVAGFYLTNAFRYQADWRGDVVLAVDAQGLILFWVGTFVMAAVAIDSARDSTRPHLVRLGGRVGRPYLASWLAGVVPAAAVAAVVTAASVVWAGRFYWNSEVTTGLILRSSCN